VKVEPVRDLEAVGAARWDALAARLARPSPFLGWTWQRRWVQAFAADRRLDLRTVVDGDRLIGLLPLYEVEAGRWGIVGGSEVSDYLDLMAADGREQDVWLALLQARAVERDRWELHAVPADSPTVTALPSLAAAYGLAAETLLEERCPVLDLPGTWDAYLASLSGKHRHELTRKIRRLERECPGARVTAVAEPDALRARLDDFVGLHRASRAGKAKFMDARMEGFFRSVIHELAMAGGARLWFLDHDTGPLASFVCLEWAGIVGVYNSGFDPRHAVLAPGLVLLAHVVRDAIERRRRRVDFLRGEERYKYQFGPTPEAVYAVTVRPAA